MVSGSPSKLSQTGRHDMNMATPAGWFPDPRVPGQVRYWDGMAWTEHTSPMQQGVPTPPPAASPGQPLAPVSASGGKNWLIRHPIWSGVIALVVIAMIAGSAGGSDSDDAKPTASDSSASAVDEPDDAPKEPASDQTKAEEAEPSSASEPEPAPEPKPAPKPEATDQDKFLDIVEVGIDAAEDADNEIKVVQARKGRGTALCSLLPRSLEVKKWTGEVEDVSTELGGDNGVLSVVISDDVAVQTWNNSLSDMDANTLIKPSSDMYGVLADLSEGDNVVFTGSFISDGDNCLEEQSLLDESGMLTPDFSFQFDSVTKK